VCAIKRALKKFRPAAASSDSTPFFGRLSQRASLIALTYAVIGTFWILMSDGLLLWAFGDRALVAAFHSFKGLGFILITALLLHRLVNRIAKAARAEEILRQDQQRLLVMLENMPVLVAALDKDNQIALWNREAEKVTGYSAAEVIGNSRIVELLLPDPDYRRATAAEIGRNTLRCRDWELQITCKDGSVRTIAVSCIARDFPIADYPGGWGIGVDVTARLARERELAEARDDLERARAEAVLAHQTAEAGSRAKSDFLAMMSHELRTPLTAVIGFADVMRGELFGPLGSPKYHEYCRDIEASGHHLLNLIDDILDLAKVESGRYVLTEGVIDLDALIRASVQLLGDRPGRKGIVLTTRVEHALKIRGDERALKQVLINLLTNAVKYTPAGGRIELTAGFYSSSGIELTVSDTGIGIPAAELALVQEPFAQASNSQTAGEDGSGLGLSIVRTLVRMHGGTLSIESDVGMGTSVTVRIPAERVLSGGVNGYPALTALR
jgi:PAS domain S-box-containing protein